MISSLGERVLDELRSAGARGVTLGRLVDLANGQSVAVVARLVESLRDAGHAIDVRLAGVYVLVDGDPLFAATIGAASPASALDPMEKQR